MTLENKRSSSHIKTLALRIWNLWTGVNHPFYDGLDDPKIYAFHFIGLVFMLVPAIWGTVIYTLDLATTGWPFALTIVGILLHGGGSIYFSMENIQSKKYISDVAVKRFTRDGVIAYFFIVIIWEASYLFRSI